MGVSRATSQAAAQPGTPSSPSALLEFAVSQAVSKDGAAPDVGLPELLRRCAAGFGVRAALALRLPAPGDPAVIAAYPPEAVDPGLMAQIAALLAGHAPVTSAAGCVQGRVAWPGLGSAPKQAGVLIAVARLPGDSSPCALALVGERAQWTADSQSAARALATVIASRIRRVEDTREIAERRAVTDALISAAPDAVVIADGARRIVEFNQAAEELHGRRSAEVLGQRLDEVLIPERNRAAFLTATTEFLRTQDPGEFAARMRLPVLRADGTERTVELTRLPLVIGGQTYFCSFARDVTELEQANAALTASEARVRLLSELAPVGIARTDDEGRCAYVNERWCAMNGQLAGDIAGTSWLESVHPGDVARIRREWARARAARAELRTDFRLRNHAGPPLWAHAAVTALPDQADLPRGFMVALTNVTARKRAEQQRDRLLAAEQAAVRELTDVRQRLSEHNEELRELDDLKTRFLATVSHELRSPLTSIVSYAELIRDEEELSPTAARFLDVIARNAERITKLVGDLLLLSQIEAGMIPLDLAPLSVADLVSEAVQASAPLAAQKGVALEGAAPDGPPVLGDRARLVQVIDNLIANAVKFTDEGGQVRVSAAADGPDWRIDVTDSGIGIPPDEIGHLFDRFFRASNAATAGRPGSGLGLSIVREVAELHGGRVEVTSHLGAGTTVHLFLPFLSALAPPVPADGGQA